MPEAFSMEQPLSSRSSGADRRSRNKSQGVFPAKLTRFQTIPIAPALQADDGKPSVLWRGMRGLIPTPHFLKHGGCEIAPMSTTNDLSIAVRYATNADNEAPNPLAASLRPEERRKTALLFRLEIESFLDMGADLSFLSAFPHEHEFLFPPLTLIQPVRRAKPLRRFLYGETVFVVIDATVRMSAA